jgi:hypothetical protein
MFRVSDNLPEVAAAIAALDRQLGDARRTAVARAVDAGAEEARTNHRFQSRSGETVAGIRGYVTVSTQAMTVGVLDSTSEASVFLNDGTRPHEIVPRNAKALRFEVGGRVVFAAHAHHPGTDADPFFDHGVERAEEILDEELDAALGRIFGD